MELIIISGKSGAGKSVALRIMEDMSFYCVDNLPISLLPNLVEILSKTVNKLAISIDIRNLPTIKEYTEAFANIAKDIKINHIFLNADNHTLIKRYSDSRRVHPLIHKTSNLEEALNLEHEKLAMIIGSSDHIIDTSNMSVHQLAEKLRFLIAGKKNKNLYISFESFGFKYGVPLNADFVFDIRFLPNPHWEIKLREYTGLQEPVIEFLQKFPEVQIFIDKTIEYLENWLPLLENNNRSYLTIAIGCTGGKHRSVYVTEQIANYFKNKNNNFNVTINIHHKSIKPR